MSAPEEEEEQTAEETETQEGVSEEEAIAEETRPRQIVKIETPLDQPEFETFVKAFMKKTKLTDKQQAAMLLSKLLFDVGLDPYGDMKDLLNELKRSKQILDNLPDTPTAQRVKDTLGGVMSAKAGRTLLSLGKGATSLATSDEGMARFEKMMDKYMPMIMAAKMTRDMMKDDDEPSSLQRDVVSIKERLDKLTAQPPTPTQVEIPELTDLKNTVLAIQDKLAEKDEAEKKEEARQQLEETIRKVTEPIKTQLDSTESELQQLRTSLTEEEEPTPPAPPKSAVDELIESKEKLEKLGIVKTEQTVEGLPPETHIASKTLDKGEKILSKAMEDAKDTMNSLLEFTLERERRAARATMPELPKLTVKEKIEILEKAAGVPTSEKAPLRVEKNA